MRVRIDAARHHELAAGVDDLAARGRREFCADLDDLAVRAQHVGPERLIGGDDRAAFDEYGHGDPQVWSPSRLIK